MDAVDQARAVLERLARIDVLRRDDAPPGVLLGEVRALLAEAESWVEAERPGHRAEHAIDRAAEALAVGARSPEGALSVR